MEKISDTITSVFRIAIENNCPAICSSGDDSIVWGDTFGLGWRFGISFNPHEWFAKVRLYLDHNHSHTEQDQATVTVTLRSSADKTATELKERMTTISDFGHGQPALLGSWSKSDIARYPFVSVTLTTNARLPQAAMDPLSSASMAIRQSMDNGDFVDTKFHVFSTRHPDNTAGKPRVVYANSDSIGLVLPSHTSGGKRSSGLAPEFLVNMTSDQHMNEDRVLHEYAYEQDSDLDEDDLDGRLEHDPVVGEFQGTQSSSRPYTQTGSMQGGTQGGTDDETPMDPPAYSASNCRMILVKGVAYRTWLSYIYFRYTGQVSFLPLKSAQNSSQTQSNDPSKPPGCSPKSMYRLADTLGDQRLKQLAFRAIKEGLSKDNIVQETFSWFTAQYPVIRDHEVDKVIELRKLPEVSAELKLQLEIVSHGERPWANQVVVAIMEKLNI